MFIFRILRRIDSVLAGFEYFIVVALLAFMAILAFLQVVLRNLFSFGFPWADELLRHSVVWVGLIGASLGIREERSIRIDIFNRFLPPRPNHINETVLNLVGVIVSIVLIHASIGFLRMEYEYNEVFSTLRISVWKVLTIYPVAFGIIALRFLLNGSSHLFKYFRGEEPH